MILLNKKCETCIHDCVCEKKGLRRMFETELSFFLESFDDEVMSEFNLSNQCKDYLELPITLQRPYEVQSAMTARNR